MCGRREMGACEEEWGSVAGSGKGYSNERVLQLGCLTVMDVQTRSIIWQVGLTLPSHREMPSLLQSLVQFSSILIYF